MCFTRIAVMALLVAWLAGPGPVASQDPAAGRIEISYDAFMTLDARARQARFGQANADTRAAIMRTHAEHWLAAHRSRLTDAQVDLVRQVIALVTPAWYRNPDDRELKKQFAALEARLACRMRHSDVMAAFRPSLDPVPANWLDDLQFWFSQCLLGR